MDRQTGVVDPIFKKKWGPDGALQLITLLSLPGQAYARVFERMLWPIVEQEQRRFPPGHGTVDQFCTLAVHLEGSQELTH